MARWQPVQKSYSRLKSNGYHATHRFEIISNEIVKPVLDERLTLTSPSFSIELFLWLLVDDRKASLRSSPPLLITVLVIVEPKFEW